MNYKWNRKKAKRCIRRFYIADEKLEGCDRTAERLDKYREACNIVDWLTDRFEIDINDKAWRSEEIEGAAEWSWQPGKLIDSVLSTASRQLPPYMTSTTRFYPFKKNI